MIECVVVLSLVGVFYAYFGYPLCLIIGARIRGVPQQRTSNDTLRSVSIIIAARNEQNKIAEKLENTLTLSRVELEKQGISIEVLVASDCSDDRTDEIVRSFANRGVHLVRSSERRGKEFAQAQAVNEAKGDIIVFTDAKVMLDTNALENMIAYFSDSNIGAVSSIDLLEGTDGSGEGFYVRYEMWLRRLETRFYSLVGLSGSCFAVRKILCDSMRSDIPSDFALLLQSVRRGFRGVLAEDVICRYRPVATEEEEFGRKVRTVLRGITTLFACHEVLNIFRYGFFSWEIWSHKVMRWLVPWFLAIAALGSIVVAHRSSFSLFVADAILLFFLSAFFAYIYPRLRANKFFKIPLYFTIANVAIAQAWLNYFRGVRSVSWTPSQKGTDQGFS